VREIDWSRVRLYWVELLKGPNAFGESVEVVPDGRGRPEDEVSEEVRPQDQDEDQHTA
jgi:hypothetical protein